MTISKWLEDSTAKLKTAGITSARLDAEVLLAYSLDKDRAWLIAHSDEKFDTGKADELLQRRLKREPVAYIRGYKEFYGRDFKVTPDTLIPRPETEILIELLAPLVADGKRLIDVGTGSGAIAITVKLEYPSLIVEATDISDAALEVAELNSKTLGADITVQRSDLLVATKATFDIIVANLPYVDTSWEVSEETHAEPSLALYANDSGLALIKHLIEQASIRLIGGGYLVLEADPRQHDDIIACGHDHDFDWYETDGFIVALERR